MVSLAWVDIRTAPPVGEPLGLITGYAGATVEVSDLDRAARFYSGLLDLGNAERIPEGILLHVNQTQALTLVDRASPRTFPGTGVHQAYTLPAPDLDAALTRLAVAGVAVHTHHEDREVERQQNRYCDDPDGNRVQLVKASSAGVDHVAVETNDIEWAEVFYTQVLGARVELRVGWRMDDFAGAWAWGNGADECAPGTRRWDTLYTEDKARVPRPNAQLFVRFADGVTLGIYIATEHRQEAPRGLHDGTPSIAFWVNPGHLGELERRLCEIRLRCMGTSDRFPGPYVREGNTLYVRDTGGNFLQFREGPR